MSREIILLPGDGIGPEIVGPTTEILQAVTGELEFEKHPFGGESIDEFGEPLTSYVLEACRQSDAVLLGAVGGPKWDSNDPSSPSPEQGLLNLREGMGMYANLRSVRPHPALQDASPLRPERIEGTDLLIVRELTGGIYFGKHERSEDGQSATDECRYSVEEIKRIARAAFNAAEDKVTSVDKANVMETSRLWREVVAETAKDYDVQLEHMLVDNAAMQIVSRPSDFEVILTENLFGDILSDESAAITGSLGMLPSASLGEPDKPGLFEPVHGSAPDIAGQGIANPLAAFLSAALMLRRGLDMPAEADAIDNAVGAALKDGLRTCDLGGKATTQEAKEAVLSHIE